MLAVSGGAFFILFNVLYSIADRLIDRHKNRPLKA